MNELNKVKVQDPSGVSLEVELISFFEVISTGKKYIFYTLNERVENDLVKMYVGEITEGTTLGDKMSEEDWTSLKQIMKAILTGSDDSDIRYLRYEGA